MAKRLVVCCDGTWDDADSSDAVTNVVRLSRAIRAVDDRGAQPIHQIVYYHSGVGTGSDLAMHLTGGAIGLGLSRNVRDAYAFIANNYCDGDEVFLFGFSRGAYTARSIAGLIGWAGLIHKVDMDDFAMLWECFKLRPRQGAPADLDWTDRRSLFKTHAGVTIKCIGVWDTVGALGIPGHFGGLFSHFYNFHDTDLGQHVCNAFQALAIDEHRRLYEPTLWKQVANPPKDQRLEQVWFAGDHADVGGGYEKHGLSDITLAWMAGRVSQMLDVDEAYLQARRDQRDAWALGKIHNSASGFTGWFGRVDRVVLATDTETLHASVDTRIAAGAGAAGGVYDPAGLRASGQARRTSLSPIEQRLQWPAAMAGRDGTSDRPGPRHLDPLLLG